MAWSLFSSGVSPKSWAVSVLQAGGWPQTAANIQSLIAWALLEGGGGTYNPLNTTQGSGTSFNSVGVKNFPSWSAGVSATVATINNGNYGTIVKDLSSGNGIGATSQLGTWSGGGYTSLASTWSRAAGYLSGQTAALPGGTSPSGTGSSGPSVTTDIWSWVKDAASGTFGLVSAPFDVGASIASLAVPFVTIAEKIDWLFHPNHWIRIVAFGGGVVFMGLGVWGMLHVGQSPGSVGAYGVSVPLPGPNLPISMLLFGVGGIGLFIAFHNVPDSVQNFSELIGWIFSNVTSSSTSGANGAAGTGAAASAAGGVATAVGSFLGNLFPATGANAANQQGGAAQSGALEPGVQGTVAGGHGR